MTVEGIKVSALIANLQKTDLTPRQKNMISLFIESAAATNGNNDILSQSELPELIESINFGFREDAEKIKEILGISSGKLPEVKEEPAENIKPQPKKEFDKSKPGAKWESVETKGFGNNSAKSLSTWERQADGTSTKTEPGMIYTSKGGLRGVMLKSHYQADDQTPIQTQFVDNRVFGVSIIVTQNHDKNGIIKNKVFNLDDFNKNKSIGTASLNMHLFQKLQYKNCKSSVVKNFNGQEVIRYKDGNFYQNEKIIAPEKVMKILEKISETAGLTFTQEF